MQRNNRASNLNNLQQGRQIRTRDHNSLLHHLRESWLVVIIGSVALISGIIVIVWNEARAVKTTKALEESISSVTEVFADAPVDNGNIGKLIYLAGSLMVQEPLTEVDYGVSVLAVKLKRRVQMYQWVEEEYQETDGNGNIVGTNYYYYTDWKDRLSDSSSFATSMGHWNPKEFPITSQTQINENVKIGDYALGLDIKKKFSHFVEVTSDERPERKDIKLHSGLYYHAQDIWKPEVGDIRIQFSYAGHHEEKVTVVGKLDSSHTIVPYKTQSNVNILILRSGAVSIEDVFAQEHAHNKFLSWIYRGGAWFLLYLGCVCLSNIIGVVVYRSRLLRDLLPNVHSSLKMTVSMSIFLLSTALAWMWYRPVLGMGLVAVMVILLFVTRNVSDSRPNRNEYSRL